MPPKVRNPKVTQFSLRLDASVNDRVLVVADRLGQSKTTAVATLVAAGLSALEPVLGVVPKCEEVKGR